MRYLVAVLALAGLMVSCFALREHFRTGAAPCDINERWDCGVVNHSPFAEIAGVPVAVFGILGYAAIAAFALARRWWIVLLLRPEPSVSPSTYLRRGANPGDLLHLVRHLCGNHYAHRDGDHRGGGAKPEVSAVILRWHFVRPWGCNVLACGVCETGGARRRLCAGGHCAGCAARRA